MSNLIPQQNAQVAAQTAALQPSTDPRLQPLDPSFPYAVLTCPIQNFGTVVPLQGANGSTPLTTQAN